jgi:very-short-patch-repair endonuclease
MVKNPSWMAVTVLCYFSLRPLNPPQGDLKKELMGKSFSHHNDTPQYITDLSRRNRLNPTKQEEKLWSMISVKKLDGLKFRRQFPIGRYIVDFYNHAHRLVMEVDGGIHRTTKEYDRNRDSYLTARGYSVLRFTNSEIDSNIGSVIQRIKDCLKVPLRGI